MASDNSNPQNAKPVGGSRSSTNPSQQTGRAREGLGNVQGQKMARQQGGEAGGTLDQGGVQGGAGSGKRGGHAPSDPDHRQLRQGTPDTEESED